LICKSWSERKNGEFAPTGASLPAGQAGKRDLGRAKQPKLYILKIILFLNHEFQIQVS